MSLSFFHTNDPATLVWKPGGSAPSTPLMSGVATATLNTGSYPSGKKRSTARSRTRTVLMTASSTANKHPHRSGTSKLRLGFTTTVGTKSGKRKKALDPISPCRRSSKFFQYPATLDLAELTDPLSMGCTRPTLYIINTTLYIEH